MKRERPRCDGFVASVSKRWPIFNWEFVACNKEFRREWCWIHITYASRDIHRYVCCECCPTNQEALDAVEKYVQDYNKRMRNIYPPKSGSAVTPPSGE
jgi:hypothetical protein